MGKRAGFKLKFSLPARLEQACIGGLPVHDVVDGINVYRFRA
jgi:hypothetical protein